MLMNRKTATKLLLVQWSRFQNECIRLEGSTLFTGVNGTGKTTILDAMTYLLTGNTQFNKAAKDRDRTVAAYVRGDTKSNGAERYLRNGEIVSYIVMEFWSPVENNYMVIGVCIESANDLSYKSSWFICRNASMEQKDFAVVENKTIRFTPRNELVVGRRKMKSADFMGRDKGVEEPGKVDSLKELREQKRQFEHIREMYENLKNSKIQLETVEQKTEEYEKKLRNLHIRRLMLCYQDLREKEEEEKEIKQLLVSLMHKQMMWENRKKELEQRCEEAGERYRVAENNDIFRGMQESIRVLEQQREKLEEEIKRYEEKLAAVKKLQMGIEDLFKWLGEFVTVEKEDRQYLCHLAEKGYDQGKKVDAFLQFAEMMKGQNRIFGREEVHCEDRMEELNTEIEKLENHIKILKSNQMVFPEPIIRAKRLIQGDLKKQGIHTDVRIFAELVQEVKDAQWRAAIETFLGRKRFHIIVDGTYCHKAMEILEQREVHGVNIVITDKLPDTSVTPGSAAEMLVIPNVYARRYANYLLNGIHLCRDLKELHEYPKGGLMKNGMLAKSYAVTYMETGKTDFCLGGDSIRLRLEKAEAEKGEREAELRQNLKMVEMVRGYQRELNQIDWDVRHYDFGAAKILDEDGIIREKLQKDIDKIRSNPDFLSVLQEQQDAKKEYEKLRGQ